MGKLCRAVPCRVDRHDEQWTTIPGFLPQLENVFGRSAFDDKHLSPWFAGLLEYGATLGYALAYTWASLQGEAGLNMEGLLDAPVARAGAGYDKVQRDITACRERRRFQAMDVEIRSLPVEDMRRAAWMNMDKNSTVWVTAWPAQESYLSNPEFLEIATFYFGQPSPICRQAVGEPIGRTGLTLDAYGLRLTTATLPGDGWRTQHDALKWRIHQDAKEMHVRHRTEVYGLFAACMPQQSRALAATMPARKRQGLVPDFVFTISLDGPERELLFELKTLHMGVSTYIENNHRCEAVARRARAIPREYSTKAQTVDRRYCNTPVAAVGPVEAKLRTYDPVRGLVFGAWGEASPDVERLLATFAKSGAERHWRDMGATNEQGAIGGLAWLLRRRWAMTALRENARLKLERMEMVGAGAGIAADRRAWAQETALARRGACRMWQGPRLPAGGRGDV